MEDGTPGEHVRDLRAEERSLSETDEEQKQIERLERKVGQLVVERDWLVKKSKELGDRLMRKNFIDRGHLHLCIRCQSELLGIKRNRLSAKTPHISEDDLKVCAEIDIIHLSRPYYGSRRMTVELRRMSITIGRGRTRRLMRLLGIVASYPKPRTSLKAQNHKIYPYLLRDLVIERPDQVWCSDITYIPMRRGFAYLVVIMDWHSRAVLSRRISNTLDTAFCVDALLEARAVAGTWPEIMNTDQGCQYTSKVWTEVLIDAGVQISMDGKRRWIDNVMVERFWWSIKYEDIYLREYIDIAQLEVGVDRWIDFYNHERPHQAHGYETPWSIWTRQHEAQAA
ncbi:MAG: putative transposase [Planctomycetota bacterium]